MCKFHSAADCIPLLSACSCVHRYVQGSGSARAAQLFTAILKTRQTLKLGAFEPAWWSACKVELPAWQGVLDELEMLACYLSSLDSLLEGMAF